jgi:hypothetical protein
MLSLKERIELLERDLQASPPTFTISADLPFAILRYDPANAHETEWHMRREIKHLATRIQNATGKVVHLISLAHLYWQSIDESEGIDEIIDLERNRGFRAAEAQVGDYLSDPDWRAITDLLVETTGNMHPAHELLFFYRAAVFAPSSYRVSTLLERLMGRVRVPAVLFYPGTWSTSLNYMGMRSDEEPLGSYRVKIYGREQ